MCLLSIPTTAEREAWRILREEAPASRLSSHPLRLSTICPTQTLGPLLQPAMNTSCSAILDLLNGSKRSILNKGKCFVDVRDVALAHVYAWEQGVEAGENFRASDWCHNRVRVGAEVGSSMEPLSLFSPSH